MDADDLADIFLAFGPVAARRMFGGLGVYADGLMFAVVVDDTIYLKTDAGLAVRLEAEGARPFTHERRGKPVSMGFWSIPDRRIDDPEAVAEIARAALGVARNSAATKARPPRRPGK
ncbi:TfoX/Sxy family protein [Ancylobacter terrae]|uniref:TfoX/Sxy family protein n=1 Tax=Ancylobacter sp. sgz301288 TaxID=3342077 RepID=UPI00385E26FE